jgi:hypothetical protein
MIRLYCHCPAGGYPFLTEDVMVQRIYISYSQFGFYDKSRYMYTRTYYPRYEPPVATISAPECIQQYTRQP